jgi:hypothetical protein
VPRHLAPITIRLPDDSDRNYAESSQPDLIG